MTSGAIWLCWSASNTVLRHFYYYYYYYYFLLVNIIRLDNGNPSVQLWRLSLKPNVVYSLSQVWNPVRRETVSHFWWGGSRLGSCCPTWPRCCPSTRLSFKPHNTAPWSSTHRYVTVHWHNNLRRSANDFVASYSDYLLLTLAGVTRC